MLTAAIAAKFATMKAAVDAMPEEIRVRISSISRHCLRTGTFAAGLGRPSDGLSAGRVTGPREANLGDWIRFKAPPSIR